MSLGQVRTPWKLARGNHKAPAWLRSGKHLAWVRKQKCLCSGKVSLSHGVEESGLSCDPPVQAAHVRTGTDAALSAKPSDVWTVPLCFYHHTIQHAWGETSFAQAFGLNLKAKALEYASRSPVKEVRERAAAEMARVA